MSTVTILPPVTRKARTFRLPVKCTDSSFKADGFSNIHIHKTRDGFFIEFQCDHNTAPIILPLMEILS